MTAIPATRWHRNDERIPWLEIMLKGERASGTLSVYWGENYAIRYEIQTSGDGMLWHTAYTMEQGEGGVHHVLLEATENRMMRILCHEGKNGGDIDIEKVELQPREDLSERTVRLQKAAAEYPGCYPRWLSNQQAYWTLTGSPYDEQEGALCEDGTLDPFKRGFTIMPLLQCGEELITRDQAKVSQTLAEGWLPIPSVHWKCGALRMDITLLADMEKKSVLYARYTVTNESSRQQEGILHLVFHPIQVYPPWQFNTDSLAPIYEIRCEDRQVLLNNRHRVYFDTHPQFFVSCEGGVIEEAEERDESDGRQTFLDGFIETDAIKDSAGTVSAVADFSFDLAAGESRLFHVAIPLHDEIEMKVKAGQIPVCFDDLFSRACDHWRRTVDFEMEGMDDALRNMWFANAAYNLVTRDGPAFQPGSRSYDKAWMRDGGVAAMALLRMGCSTEIRTFLEWMATYQQESGEIPPIIDNKHEDPLWEEKQNGLQEFDSQGEFVQTLYEYVRFTGDKDILKTLYPVVKKALKFLSELRRQRCTDEFCNDPDLRRFYNILPPSRSHEGYWLAHSYWDDFWALAGWRSGAELAALTGEKADAEWMRSEYEQLRSGVYDSVKRVMQHFDIDYLPGCAEKGDYDAASSAAAITYCHEGGNLPPDAVSATFSRFCTRLDQRLEPGAEYSFTPYEARIIPALLRVGWRTQALKLAMFLVNCRRPAGWYHLAEVVHSDPRFPCYIGDMPHTWVGAEMIVALRSLFAYESDEKLVLGAGVDAEWLNDGQVLSLKHFPTWFGRFDVHMQRDANLIRVNVQGEALPQAGIEMFAPLSISIRDVSVTEGTVEIVADDRVVISALPAAFEIVC